MNKWHDVWNKAEHSASECVTLRPQITKENKVIKKIKKKRIDKATEDFLEIPGVEEASEFRFDSTIHVHRHKKNSRAIIRNT